MMVADGFPFEHVFQTATTVETTTPSGHGNTTLGSYFKGKSHGIFTMAER